MVFNLLKFGLFLLGTFMPMLCFAQIPGLEITEEDSLHTDLEYNTYNLSFIYLKNTNTDSLFLSWELTEKVLEEEWYVTICDNVTCYGVLPDGADMYGIAPDQTVYIRMEVNPYEHDGFGHVRLLITETNNPQSSAQYLDFTFETKNHTSTYQLVENLPNLSIYPNPYTDYLYFSNPSNETIQVVLIDIQGAALKSFSISPQSNTYINTENLPSIYAATCTISSQVKTIPLINLR